MYQESFFFQNCILHRIFERCRWIIGKQVGISSILHNKINDYWIHAYIDSLCRKFTKINKFNTNKKRKQMNWLKNPNLKSFVDHLLKTLFLLLLLRFRSISMYFANRSVYNIQYDNSPGNHVEDTVFHRTKIIGKKLSRKIFFFFVNTEPVDDFS